MSIVFIVPIHTQRNTIGSHLSATQVAEYFSIEPIELNKILQNLKWIEKEYHIWWVATLLGKKNGAVEQIHENDRVKYVSWSKEILENKELNLAVRRYIYTNKTDKAYKHFISKYYLNHGYTVWNHTADRGLEDKNINYIAKKSREILLINCRGHPVDITLDEIKIFEQQKNAFILENPVFAEYNVKLLYNMSGFFLTEEAFEYIKENGHLISYQILK